jgi:acetyltransferase-like isoleucine patch superfamily enzyme
MTLPPIVPSFRWQTWFKIVLGVIASHLFGPAWLIAWLHRIRGVKVANIHRVFIAGNVLIDSRFPELVEIAEEVYITRNVVILTHLAPSPFLETRIGGVRSARVVIGLGAYIGVGAIILPGVVIGEGSVVGAGAVVTKDVPAYTMVAGNPARIIKSVDDIVREDDNDL